MTDSYKPQIKINYLVLPMITFVLLILVMIDVYRGWVILFVAFGGVFIFSYFWVLALARGLKIRREMRLGWAQVGDRLEERFTLINQSRFPAIWVEVIGQTNMPNYWANQVRSVRGRAETRWQIRGTCTRRGVYILGPTTVYASDPLGIFTVTFHNPASTTLVVTPPILPLPPIQVAPGGRAGDGLLRVKALQEDINSVGVREYRPGDSMRRIHWPTSAKQAELHVRVFEKSPAGDWWIVLDLDREVQVGQDEASTLEHGIVFAASLVDLGLRTGRSVGFATHSDELVWHRAQISDEHKWQILHSLALVQPGIVPLSKLLSLIHPRANRKASLIIITPDVEGQWLPSLIALRRLGVVPTVLLLDPKSFGSDKNISYLRDRLMNLGINHRIITKESLDRGELPTNQMRDWGWQDSSAGEVVPLRSSEEFSWQDLG